MQDWVFIIPEKVYEHKSCKNALNYEKVKYLLWEAVRKLMGYDSNVDVRKLRGNCEGQLRIKAGKCRIIFTVDWDTKTVEVICIGHRKNVYKDC